MSLGGKLGAGGGADLLLALWSQGRSGILDVVAGGADRKLVFDEGEVVQVVSSDNTERLPVRLASRGLVEKSVLVQAMKAGADVRKSLAEKGALPAEAHDRELHALVTDVIAAVFPLQEGQWSFVDRTDLDLPGCLASFDMAQALWAAARRTDGAFARAFLGDRRQRLLKPGDDALLTSLPGLTPHEGFVVSRIDGYGSMDDLVAASPLGVDATLSLVLALTCVGYTDAASRPGVKLPRPSKPTTGRRTAAAKPTARPTVRPAGPSPSSAAAGPEDSPAKVKLSPLEEAREMHARVQGADHYAVLGVTRSASPEEIRRAYYALARVHHPDRHSGLGPADRDLVEALFARVGDAFAVLSAEEKRRAYDEQLATGVLTGERAEAKAVDRRELARESAAKGRAALAAGDRATALGYFEHAVQVDGDNWEHRMAFARVLVRDSRTRRRAEEHLAAAIRIDPAKADAYHELGRVYAAANLKTRALEQYRKGLEWDSTHSGILAALAELGG